MNLFTSKEHEALRAELSKQAHEQFAALNEAAKELGCPPIRLEMGVGQRAMAAAFIALTAARKASASVPPSPSPK